MHTQQLKAFFAASNSKTQNLKRIYELIIRSNGLTSEIIMDKTNIKPATCARLLDELVQNNFILADEFAKSTGGRKPIRYRVNPTVGYVIGIEVTNLFTTILLMDMELTIIDKIKLKTPDIEIDDQLLALLLTNLEILLSSNKISARELLGIGISTDDLIGQSKLNATEIELHLSQIKARIYQQIPTYITFGSGTNFAAIAEHKLHYSDTSKRFLFTRCDLEIHSSTIIDGTIPFTNMNITNGLGHTTIDFNGKKCSCGSRGCVYQYSSLEAIKIKIIEAVKQGRTSAVTDFVSSADEIDYLDILRASEANDPLCGEILAEAAYYYSIALFNFILAFQPDTVICGGALVPKSTFFNVIKLNIEKKLLLYPQLKTKIYPASASYEIVTQGAGAMILEKFLQ